MGETPETKVTAAFLGEQINRAKVPEGTVVKFDRTLTRGFDAMRMREAELRESEPKTITYAAIFVANRWYFTGKGALGNERLTNRDFIERMSEDDISNIQVAGEFTSINS